MDYSNPICPECGSNRISYNAIRTNETEFDQYYFTCNECGTQFGLVEKDDEIFDL